MNGLKSPMLFNAFVFAYDVISPVLLVDSHSFLKTQFECLFLGEDFPLPQTFLCNQSHLKMIDLNSHLPHLDHELVLSLFHKLCLSNTQLVKKQYLMKE